MKNSILNSLLPDDVQIDEWVVSVNNLPIGILVPSSIYFERNGVLHIYGPKGCTDAQVNNLDDVWSALITSGSILFGINNEPYTVQSLLLATTSSKITSYLSAVCNNCTQLIKAYEGITSKAVAVIGLGGIVKYGCYFFSWLRG